MKMPAQDKTSIAYIVPMGKGLDSFVYREIEQMTKAGLRIVLFSTRFKKHDVFSPKPEWPCFVLSPKLLPLVAPVILLRALAKPSLFWHALKNNALIDLVFALHYVPRMRRSGVRQIHCHFGDHKLFIGYYCRRLTGLPLSVTIHSHELHVNRNEQMFRIALRECERIFAISELAVDLLVNRYGAPADRVALSRLCVDLSDWSDKAPLRVVTVGRFEPQKGFEYLFRAAALLRDLDIEFVVVGFGPIDVKALARDAGVENCVVFFEKLGQAQLRMLYQQSDIYCLPSIQHPEQGMEGIPVVLMEAMSCGMPVVATSCGAVGEIVDEILVEERDAQQLADAIARLAGDSELRIQQGMRNRQIVEQKFSMENIQRFMDELTRIPGDKL
jgi:glycosyltransferase involved in cell wall biosynthesis